MSYNLNRSLSLHAVLHSAVGRAFDRFRDHKLNPSSATTFVEIDHEIISTVILPSSADSRRAVVEGQLSITGQRMCTSSG